MSNSPYYFFLSQTVKHAVKIVCLILSLCPSNLSRLVNRRLPTDRTIGLMEDKKVIRCMVSQI